MGLKSGSRESGIDESEQEGEREEPDDGRTEPDPGFKARDEEVPEERDSREGPDRGKRTAESKGISGSNEGDGSDETGGPGDRSQGENVEAEATGKGKKADESNSEDTVEGKSDTEGQFSVDSLPYKLRRQNVNEGREQVPYFLRPEITEQEEKLKRTLEDELGETVYKSDYREAAMVVAQRNPELIAEVLREWGYDLPE